MKREDAITLIIIAVAIFALYYINKFIKGATSVIGAPEGSTTGGSEQDKPEVSKLSYPPAKYKQLADTIETAVWGGLGLTEDDQAIEDALVQMANDDDFLALSAAYGVRGRGIVLRDYYNLVQTIELYLDDDSKARVNQDYKNKKMTTHV